MLKITFKENIWELALTGDSQEVYGFFQPDGKCLWFEIVELDFDCNPIIDHYQQSNVQYEKMKSMSAMAEFIFKKNPQSIEESPYIRINPDSTAQPYNSRNNPELTKFAGAQKPKNVFLGTFKKFYIENKTGEDVMGLLKQMNPRLYFLVKNSPRELCGRIGVTESAKFKKFIQNNWEI